MPAKKKAIVKRDSEAELQFGALKERYWISEIKELMTLHKEEALRRDKVGADLRRDIFDRIWGKPLERREEESKQAIEISIYPVLSKDQTEPIEGTKLLLLPPTREEKEIILDSLELRGEEDHRNSHTMSSFSFNIEEE